VFFLAVRPHLEMPAIIARKGGGADGCAGSGMQQKGWSLLAGATRVRSLEFAHYSRPITPERPSGRVSRCRPQESAD